MIRKCKIRDDMPEQFNFMPQKSIVSKDFEFEVITPMIGGGVKSWELDLNSPVRGQSVKGQLRFWWRTMQDVDDYETLLLKENEVWGGKVKNILEKNGRIKSPVSLQIIHDKIKEKDNIVKPSTDYIPQYVLFPVTTGNNSSNAHIKIIRSCKFTLKMTFPKRFEDQVINTLKLWTLFGGVGARTRRGTGSLYCKELLETFDDENAIRTFIRSGSTNNLTKLSYPRMSGAQLFVRMIGDADTAQSWMNLLENYGRFRQDRTGKNNQGRSHWPEPDAVRRLTGENAANHKPVHPDEKWFPRSAFGLPILMGFSTYGDPGKEDPSRGLTQNISLQPNIGTGDRLPSPVIIKVIKLPENKTFQCVLVLNQAFPNQLVLKYKDKTYDIQGNMLPCYEGYENDKKTMRTNHPLDGKTIYQDLANHLGLKEVP